MTTVKKVLEIASKEIGYQETGNNNNKYGVWYGMNNQPWCYIFVSWVLIKAGMNVEKCASCPVGYDYYKRNGKLFKEPKPGDLAFFSWNPSLIPQHIGIVEKVNNNGTFTCIEGNTSSGLTGSQDNGDGVYRKLRRLSDCLGFGHPDYQETNDYQGHWAEASIKWALDNNIISDSKNTFPDKNITRAEMLTMLKNFENRFIKK
jgi:hypothetical protein